MKIAVIISGYFRGFNETKHSIKNNILHNSDHEYDIFIQYSKNSYENKYQNEDIRIEDINEFFLPKLIICIDDLRHSSNINENNTINQNYKAHFLYQNTKTYAGINNRAYDIVVKLRPDVYFENKIDFDNIEKNLLYVPMDSKIDVSKLKQPTDQSICDTIAYGDANIMDKYFDFFKYNKELIRSYGYVNETILWHYLNNNKITYKETDINYIIILSKCTSIAITGDSGSGKTTVSKILKKIFTESLVLECDRYHKWERGDLRWNKYTHLNPEANYITKMNKDVFDLRLGKTIFQVDYDHTTGKFTDLQTLDCKDTVIVCGLHSMYIDKELMNLKIYIDTDDDLRFFWKIQRDTKERGYSKGKIYEQIKVRKEDFDKYILPQKKHADLIIRMYSPGYIFDINSYESNMPDKIQAKIGINHRFDASELINILSGYTIEQTDSMMYVYLDNIHLLEATLFKIIKILKI